MSGHINEEQGVPPAYRVRTERLVLRCWNPTDAPMLKEAIDCSVKHLLPWMPWAHQEPEELQVKVDRLRQFRAEFDMGSNFIVAIFSDDEQRVIGGTGLHPRVGDGAREIGYWIRSDEVGKGYATEAAAAMTRVGFEVEALQRIEIHCDPQNRASARVAEKLGYVREATLRKRLPRPDGEMRDAMIWTMLAEEYPKSLASSIALEAFDVMNRRIL